MLVEEEGRGQMPWTWQIVKQHPWLPPTLLPNSDNQKNTPRHCQMSPGKQNYLLMRIIGLALTPQMATPSPLLTWLTWQSWLPRSEQVCLGPTLESSAPTSSMLLYLIHSKSVALLWLDVCLFSNQASRSGGLHMAKATVSISFRSVHPSDIYCWIQDDV